MLSALAGIGFVVWAPEQQWGLLRLTMFSEGTITNREISMSSAGENLIVVLARVCEGSESFTAEDLIVLNFFYNETIEIINRMRGLYPENAREGNSLEGRFSFIFGSGSSVAGIVRCRFRCAGTS